MDRESTWDCSPQDNDTGVQCFVCEDARHNNRCASCSKEATAARLQLLDRLEWIRETAQELWQHRYEMPAVIAPARDAWAREKALEKALAEQLKGMAKDAGVKL